MAGRLKHIARLVYTIVDGGLEQRVVLKHAESVDLESPVSDSVRAAVRLRRLCERLGPTFVKFGQFLALRRDLFSDEFCTELAKLHSNVAPFPAAEARRIIEAELGKNIEAVFASFDDNPAGSASIAQVHFAVLKTGEHVAIKVQRPGAEELIRSDLAVLTFVAKWLDRILAIRRKTVFHEIARDFGKVTTAEVDFLCEADFADDLKKALVVVLTVYVPIVYRELSTPRILVLERLFGTRLDEFKSADDVYAKGIDPHDIAATLSLTLTRQLFDFGLVHLDMHPGNVFVLDRDRIGLVDFGMHVRLPKQMRWTLLRDMFLRLNGSYEEWSAEFLKLMQPGRHTNIEALQRDLIRFARSNDGKSLTESSMAKKIFGTYHIMRKHRCSAPTLHLMVFMRAVLAAEGICMGICPDYEPIVDWRDNINALIEERLSKPRMRSSLSQAIPDMLRAVDLSSEISHTLLMIMETVRTSPAIDEFFAQKSFVSSLRVRLRVRDAVTVTIAIMVGYLVMRA